MDDLVSSLPAQNFVKFCGAMSGNLAGIIGIISGQATRQNAPAIIHHHNQITLRELSFDAQHTGGQ